MVCRRLVSLVALVVLLCVPAFARADLITGRTVAGLGTFLDTTNNRTWLRLDNFMYKSPAEMEQIVTAAGFTLATRDDVWAVVSQTFTGGPPVNGEYPADWSYSEIIGHTPNRTIIWGVYRGSDPTRQSWAVLFHEPGAWYTDLWEFRDDTQYLWTSIQNGDDYPPFADQNIWAYQTTVPEPASLLLLGTGLTGLIAARRRRR